MSQIFRSSANATARVSIILALVVLAGTGGALFELIANSTYATRQGDAREQPIPFSHAHHVGSMGIDCRYCHTSVENSDFSVVPPTKTCMNCHSQMWTNAPMLEPVREPLPTDRVFEAASNTGGKGVGARNSPRATKRLECKL